MDANKINFEKLIDELRICGYSVTDIAEEIGTSQPNISRLKNGRTAEPGYALGTRLVQFHRNAMFKLRRKKRLEKK